MSRSERCLEHTTSAVLATGHRHCSPQEQLAQQFTLSGNCHPASALTLLRTPPVVDRTNRPIDFNLFRSISFGLHGRTLLAGAEKCRHLNSKSHATARLICISHVPLGNFRATRGPTHVPACYCDGSRRVVFVARRRPGAASPCGNSGRADRSGENCLSRGDSHHEPFANLGFPRISLLSASEPARPILGRSPPRDLGVLVWHGFPP